MSEVSKVVTFSYFWNSKIEPASLGCERTSKKVTQIRNTDTQGYKQPDAGRLPVCF